MKICIYTVILGGYDSYQEHVEQDIPCDYICFTDNVESIKNKNVKVFKDSLVNKIDNKISDANKNIIDVVLFRSNLFLIDKLKGYDVCIYIDGNAKIVKKDFVRKMIEYRENYDIIISRHPHRGCIYSEARVCFGITKYNNTDLEKQISDYKKDGYPENNGLYWNGLIVYFYPFDDKMKPFYNIYTEHLIKYVKDPELFYHPQGQVSLPYVLSKTNLRIKVISNEYNGEHINITHHLK